MPRLADSAMLWESNEKITADTAAIAGGEKACDSIFRIFIFERAGIPQVTETCGGSEPL